jgi:hypothetical protein
MFKDQGYTVYSEEAHFTAADRIDRTWEDNQGWQKLSITKCP